MTMLVAMIDKLGHSWRQVSFSADTDEDGLCSLCKRDYTDCGCPGPTQDGMEYCEIDGILFARQEGVTE